MPESEDDYCYCRDATSMGACSALAAALARAEAAEQEETIARRLRVVELERMLEAESRLAEATALLVRIEKYAREDRASTGKFTRLARVLDETREWLKHDSRTPASPDPTFEHPGAEQVFRELQARRAAPAAESEPDHIPFPEPEVRRVKFGSKSLAEAEQGWHLERERAQDLEQQNGVAHERIADMERELAALSDVRADLAAQDEKNVTLERERAEFALRMTDQVAELERERNWLTKENARLCAAGQLDIAAAREQERAECRRLERELAAARDGLAISEHAADREFKRATALRAAIDAAANDLEAYENWPETHFPARALSALRAAQKAGQ